MIEITGLSKGYFGKTVLEDISFVCETGAVCGLIGYNGAGKTTLLRCMAGIYRPDAGSVRLGGEDVWENAGRKAETFLLAEDPYFLPQATLFTMRDFYRGYTPSWDDEVFERLMVAFRLPGTQKISSFSKGMRRQAGILLAFSATPKYLFLDEIFDGLDLAMRRVMRTLLAAYVRTRQATAVVTSHNLRELEDGIDKIVMIRQNRLTYEGPVADIREAHGTLEAYFLGEREVDESAFSGVFQ
ncbi:MAG: ABC transporter ATP-binding protein [Clostridiales Family XIII bacterium]|jgi:ABC-2 type transport system ATP-binding protein|nr:ABC transporter ATP-binding protein [Clostridiales Family XIII bacterium]